MMSAVYLDATSRPTVSSPIPPASSGGNVYSPFRKATSEEAPASPTARTPLLGRSSTRARSMRRMSTTETRHRRSSMGTFLASSANGISASGSFNNSYGSTRIPQHQPPAPGNRRFSTYWRSFDKYTPFVPPSNSFGSASPMSPNNEGSTFAVVKKRCLDQFMAIREEKCNGEVRFDVTDLEAGGGNSAPHKRSSSTVKVIRRRQSGYGIAITSDSTAKMRCRQRKQLFQRRNKVCDLSLVLAIIGLILVVADAELNALNILQKQDTSSLAIRTVIVLTTIALIFSLFNYHRVEVQIALIDSGADDWRVALTTERMIKLAIEVTVCAICPFPGSGIIHWPYISPEERTIEMVPVPVDVLLSVPMFLRSYLLCRFMVLHSKQYMDAATRSIAALNRISMDFRFVIKTMMADHPLTVLVVFTVSYWICMSWMFTQCERYNGRLNISDHYYLNSLWFVTVSFLSVGYGDIVPSTYCGRMLAITTGIVGAGVSSALIAVISRKLELSRAEKHVNNFMADSKLTNQRKNAAASVLQQTWFIHKYQRTTNKGDDLRLRHHQRKFLNAINDFRRIKWDQRKLAERGNSLLDVGKLHNEMHETLWEMHRTQDQFITQIDMLTQKILELQNTITNQGSPQNPQNPASTTPSYTRQFSVGGGSTTLQVPGSNPNANQNNDDSSSTIDNNGIETVVIAPLQPPPTNTHQHVLTRSNGTSTEEPSYDYGHGPRLEKAKTIGESSPLISNEMR